jgi:hypothetical protein
MPEMRREQEAAGGLYREFLPWDEELYERTQDRIDRLDKKLGLVEEKFEALYDEVYGDKSEQTKEDFKQWISDQLKADRRFQELSDEDQQQVRALIDQQLGDSWRVFRFLQAGSELVSTLSHEDYQEIEKLAANLEELNSDGSLDESLALRLNSFLQMRNRLERFGGEHLETMIRRAVDDAIDHYRFNIKKETPFKKIPELGGKGYDRYIEFKARRRFLDDKFRKGPEAMRQFQEQLFGGAIGELMWSIGVREEPKGIEVSDFDKFPRKILPEIHDNNEAFRQVAETIIPPDILDKSVNYFQFNAEKKLEESEATGILASTAADYDYRDRAITFYSVGLEPHHLPKVLLHEFGHSRSSGRFERLGEALSISLEWRQIASEEEVFVTPYVEQNYVRARNGEQKLSRALEEDWAESFTMYILDPDYLKRVAPRRYGLVSGFFMDNLGDLDLTEVRVNYRKASLKLMGIPQSEAPRVLVEARAA